MHPSLLLALLGTLTLPGEPARVCQRHFLETVSNSKELFLEWQAARVVCGNNSQDWRCQDTLLLVDNGLQVSLVLTKGCTLDPVQEARITQHRADPGLSVFSYTRVCDEDRCNNLSSTFPRWAMPSPTAPGPVQCPFCLSAKDCLSPVVQPCPVGNSHCYNGVLLMQGGGISTKLRVQGCMPQAGCNLLNGTQQIGPITLKENCYPKREGILPGVEAFLTCQRGVMNYLHRNLSWEPIKWTTPGTQRCNMGEVCQETLLLVDVGPKSVLVGSKGCSDAQTHDSQNVTSHGGHHGVLLASYAHFCTSQECNRANSSSVLLNSLSPSAVPVPGDLLCPVCLELFGSCSENSQNVTCPKGTTSCYSGFISLGNGGLSLSIHIKGCMTQNARSLLHHIKNIGIFSVEETLENEPEEQPSSQMIGATWPLHTQCHHLAVPGSQQHVLPHR
ncbi:CD177 antigen isoform X2 [Talpa occidentalis]|uniref:CD177 antigen isoform X2 n=1 Tax=Talpa occidentalis TaxID=50954 RepID=UPI00188F7C97|nr:CD177 antigen isoform X2 [Talpa occidentalis]